MNTVISMVDTESLVVLAIIGACTVLVGIGRIIWLVVGRELYWRYLEWRHPTPEEEDGPLKDFRVMVLEPAMRQLVEAIERDASGVVEDIKPISDKPIHWEGEA